MNDRWILVLLLSLALAGLAVVVLESSASRGQATRAATVDSAVAPLRVARPGLRTQATIAPGEAWANARAALEPGTPIAGTLTELGGRLVYVLVFARSGRLLTEVIVDAGTGRVLSHQSETSAPAVGEGVSPPVQPPHR